MPVATAELLAGRRGSLGGSTRKPWRLDPETLDAACMVGAVPAGYGWPGDGPVSLATYFALARGALKRSSRPVCRRSR
jgi:hypothetical protein